VRNHTYAISKTHEPTDHNVPASLGWGPLPHTVFHHDTGMFNHPPQICEGASSYLASSFRFFSTPYNQDACTDVHD